MALRTLGTAGTTSLNCLTNWSAVLTDADVSAIARSITSDTQFGAVLSGLSAGAEGVIATGSTHGNTTLDTLAAVAGAPLAQIKVGMLVLGVGIVPGTYVQALLSGTSVQLSQAATTTAAGVAIGFVSPDIDGSFGGMLDRGGNLVIPNRGRLRLWPGDVVAIDNAGWPILVSGASIAMSGSLWTLT